jgi:hypothetical protein
MWLGGFSNQGTSTDVQIGGVFFDNTASTWFAGMATVNPSGDDFTVYYYYL